MLKSLLRSIAAAMLLSVSCHAALLTTYSWRTSYISCQLPWVLVTDDSTPEWAKLPNSRQWVMLQNAIQFNDAPGLLLVLRAVQFFNSRETLWWMDIYSPGSDSEGDASNTPEPASYALLLSGAALLYGYRKFRCRFFRSLTPATSVHIRARPPSRPRA
jgi:hypothetical protein